MLHKELRHLQFNTIEKCLQNEECFSIEKSIALLGDSLEKIKLIPDSSISLILTDPPYHSTKKDNIANDKAFSTDDDFILWMNEYFIEWKRILKPNGSIFMFCSSAMSAKLEVAMSENFNILSHVVWSKPNDPGFDGWKGKMKKESLRQWYPHSERILFAEPATIGNLKRSWFGSFLREMRTKAEISGHQLTELTGSYGKVNHGGAVSNWETGRNIPSREQYDKICEVLIGTGKINDLPDYEDVIRKFEVSADIQFTDVWDFNSVRPYNGKHPAEKPLEMLEHCINATTFEDDIILDCFGGSGSTSIAALNLNRYSISIELEKEWYEVIKMRLANYEEVPLKTNGAKSSLMKATKKVNTKHQVSLFS
ncbi:MAG: site-specific DNA-methyltransferase [Bacteroidia bacterium]|nr:site-specific DNA-methyltransferase [Bacteroidia bacterium]